MRILSLQLCLTFVVFWLTSCFAAPNFVLVKSFSKPFGYGARSDIRIIARNYASWEYRACVAEASAGGNVFTLDIISNYSSSLKPGIAPNNGSLVYDLTVIQGLTDCGYAALVNTTLYNVVLGDTRTSDLGPQGGSYFYAVWTNNQVRTFVMASETLFDRLNATTRGTFNYSVLAEEGMAMTRNWQIYYEIHSQITYMAYTLINADYNAYLLGVYKCTPECTRELTLNYSKAHPTITANSTHWFMCYKDYVIVAGISKYANHTCTVQGLVHYSMPQIDADYPLGGYNDYFMFSCVVDNTIMMLTVFDAISLNYTLYSLDTTAEFAVLSSIDGTGYLSSMTCVDQVVLVVTSDAIDYYAWDNGVSATTSLVTRTLTTLDQTGIVFPLPPEPSSNPPATDEPINIPTVNTPQDTVNQNNTATGELSSDKKVLVGVLIGVGVPVIAGAIVLIILRKKLKRKSTSNESKSVYTSINKVHNIDPTQGKLIPFKKIAFTKEIGSGSYGKVFLGTWDGKTVAIKVANHVADTESFLAEARLTLSVPSHPNLVQTFGVSMDTNTPYLVLEYCEGGSLDQIVFNQTIGHKEQRALVLGIAQGLLHLHLNKIVHRDLAVRNILLKDGIPKISDFGMSRVLKEESAQGKTKTTVGPIRWMAPESIEDMTYSPKSDVWTFGIVVSEIVLGHEPHHNESQLDVAVRIRDEGFAPIIPDDSDPVLKELMEMCWKLNPDDRPTMQQIIEYLYKYL